MFDRSKPTVGCSANGRRENIKLILVDCHSRQNTGLSQNVSNCKLNQWLAYKYKFCNEISTCSAVYKSIFCTWMEIIFSEVSNPYVRRNPVVDTELKSKNVGLFL